MPQILCYGLVYSDAKKGWRDGTEIPRKDCHNETDNIQNQIKTQWRSKGGHAP